MSNHEHPSAAYRVLLDYEAMKGTERYGFIQTSYDHLIGLFGQPLQGDGRKTDVQWIVETGAGTGTVYNFNLAERTAPIETITDWHVGGTDESAAQTVIRIV